MMVVWEAAASVSERFMKKIGEGANLHQGLGQFCDRFPCSLPV